MKFEMSLLFIFLTFSELGLFIYFLHFIQISFVLALCSRFSDHCELGMQSPSQVWIRLLLNTASF